MDKERLFCAGKRVSPKSSMTLSEMPDGLYAIQVFRVITEKENMITQRMLLSPAALSALYDLIGLLAIDKNSRKETSRP